jgi:inner membrane transporter RhtA
MMNCSFYLAIDRVPLGSVAAVEFVTVIVLAAAAARTARNGFAVVLAASGVAVVSDVRLQADALGLALTFTNAVLFALYVVVAHRVARHARLTGLDGLTAAMLVAAVLVSPLAGPAVVPALGDPIPLAAGAGVGVCSSVIPYALDQLVMRRLPRATYALMLALLPATATAIGVVILAHVPSAAELAGVALVVAGVAVHRAPVSAAA